MKTLRSSFGGVLAAALLSASPARGQMLVHYGNDGGGASIAGLGDLNADGHADFVVPRISGIAALSGVDRSVVWEIPIATPYEATGYTIDNAGDVDGDGQDDLIIGNWGASLTAPYQGVVRIYSGATQALLHEWYGPYPWARFGVEVSPAGDADSDGFADVIVSATPSGCCPSQPNFVDVYSGFSGARLHHFVDPIPWGGFGYSIAAAGDVDADGFDDVLIGALAGWTGHAYVYSGENGSMLHDLVGSAGFGAAVSRIGDIDADGFDDIAVAAPDEFVAPSPAPRGWIHAFSGRTALPLWSSAGLWPSYYFGVFLKSLGDVDGDGAKDLLAAASQGGWGPVDKLALVSGRTGAVLADAQHLGDAKDIAALGDINGDGLDDFGANGWPSHVGANVYDVFLSNAPAPTPYCTAKTNSQGCLPFIYLTGPGPCLSVGDDLHVRAYYIVGDTSGALVWSLSQASTPFAGGTLCIGSPSTILAVRKSDHAGSGCSGGYDFALRRSYLLNQGLTAGTTLYAQIISRDPGFAPPNNFGLTDALAITIAP